MGIGEVVSGASGTGPGEYREYRALGTTVRLRDHQKECRRVQKGVGVDKGDCRGLVGGSELGREGRVERKRGETIA
jgi:hypothetical protein